MGKHFWMRHTDDESHHKQPGCMWGLFHVRRMIQNRKYEGSTHDERDWDPKTKLYHQDDCEMGELLDKKESWYLATKNYRATKKRDLKARIKALVAEEVFKPNFQRTYSIHHLESLDVDLKHPIIFHPGNVKNFANPLLDITETMTADNQEASSGKSNLWRPENAAKHGLNGDPDVLEIFKVDRGLLIKHLQHADESIANFSRSALGLNTETRFSKSRSFPLSKLSQRRKLKPVTLESKRTEICSFSKDDKFLAVNRAPGLVSKGYFGTGPPSECFEEIADRNLGNAMGGTGEKTQKNDAGKCTNCGSSSLNESLDKYARLFESSLETDIKLTDSKSLKLPNKYNHAPVCFRRMRSLSNVDSYYSASSFEVLGDDLFGNGLTIAAEDTNSGLHNSGVENTVMSDGENVSLITNTTVISQKELANRCNAMKLKADDASLTSLTHDLECEKVDSPKEEADKLKHGDSLWEQETNCSDITPEELAYQGFVLDSDIGLQETQCHTVQLQISEGLDQGSSIDELNFAIDTKDLKSLHSKHWPTHSTENLANDEISDKIVECSMHDGCPKKIDSELYYVSRLLDQSGIAFDASEIAWHASDKPFGPNLFKELEACWPHEQDLLNGYWHHQMLFDLINEVLVEIYDISLPYYPKALSLNCRVRPFPVGNRIIEEVRTRIGTMLNLKQAEKQPLDCTVANDSSWMNLQLETECVALELEDMIFDELLEEFVFP